MPLTGILRASPSVTPRSDRHSAGPQLRFAFADAKVTLCSSLRFSSRHGNTKKQDPLRGVLLFGKVDQKRYRLPARKTGTPSKPSAAGSMGKRRSPGAQPKKKQVRQTSAFSEPCGGCSDVVPLTGILRASPSVTLRSDRHSAGPQLRFTFADAKVTLCSNLRFSSRHGNTKKQDPLRGVLLFGAADRTRTGTVSLPADFKSALSTYSNTTAYDGILSRFRSFVKPESTKTAA